MSSAFSKLLKSMGKEGAPAAEPSPDAAAADSSDGGSTQGTGAKAARSSSTASLQSASAASATTTAPDTIESRLLRSADALAIADDAASNSRPTPSLGTKLPATTLGNGTTFDIDSQGGAASAPQLEAEVVASIPPATGSSNSKSSSSCLPPRRTTAATETIFAYGLVTGAVRLLARGGGNAVRALARGHRAPLTDIAFAPAAKGAPPGTALLATADEEGCVGVWTVELRRGSLDVARAAFFNMGGGAGGGRDRVVGAHVAWHPTTLGLLAASVGAEGASAFLIDCAAVAETAPATADEAATEPQAIELGGEALPTGVARLPGASAAAVTALAFSPSGSHLTAGTLDSCAMLWALPGGVDAEDAVDAAAAARPPSKIALGLPCDDLEADGRRIPCEVEFVPCPGPSTLLARRGPVLSLFDAARAARSADGAGSKLAELTLAGEGLNDNLCGLTSLVVAAAPSSSSSSSSPLPPLAVVSLPARKLLIAVTLSKDGRDFAAVAAFKVAAPVLSAAFAPPAEAAESEDGAASPSASAANASSTALSVPHWAQLLAAQRDAVQVLSLDAAACSAAADGGAAASAAGEAASKAATARRAASRKLGGGMLSSAPKEPSGSSPTPAAAALPAPLARLLTPSALARASSAASSGPASPAAEAPLPKPVAAVKLSKGAPKAATPVAAAEPAPDAPSPKTAAVAPAPAAAASLLSSASAASIIAEIKAEGARSAAAAEASTARAVAAASAAAAEDRALLLATEHAALEKLLSGVSASVNRDLPARIEEIVKREVRAAVCEQGGKDESASAAATAAAATAATATCAAAATRAINDLDLASATSSAVASALPAALSASLPAAVSAALPTALSAALKPALADAVEKTLLPAFEKCCREMFSQVTTAFTAGLAEHLTAAGEAPRAYAESLRESVERLGQISAALERGGAGPPAERGGRGAAVATAAASAAAGKGKAPVAATAASSSSTRGKAAAKPSAARTRKAEVVEIPEELLPLVPSPPKEEEEEEEKEKEPSAPPPTKEEEVEEEEKEEEEEEEEEEVKTVVEAREAEAEAEEEAAALAAAAAAKDKEEAKSASEEDEDGDFAPDDPKASLRGLVSRKLFGQAFEAALDLSDVAVVEWLATQVAPADALSEEAKDPLSQPVLLALLQQLGSDLSDGLSSDEVLTTKLSWVREAARELDAEALGPALAPHVRPILSALVAELKKLMSAAGVGHADAARAAAQVVNSVLHQCS